MVLGACCEAEATPDTTLAVVDCDGASDSGLSGVSVGLSEGDGPLFGPLGLADPEGSEAAEAAEAVTEAARMIEPTSLSRLQYNVLLADNM